MNMKRLRAFEMILFAGLPLAFADHPATFAQTRVHDHKPTVIDGHRHVGDGGFLGDHFSAGHLIEEMDRLGIERAVILPMGKMPATAEEDKHKLAEMEKANDDYFHRNIVGDTIKKLQTDRMDHTVIINAIRLYPSRLVGVYIINPWLGEVELKAAEHASEKRGFRGMKLHPVVNAFRADDAVVDPVLKLARRLKVPVMFHTSFGLGSEPTRVAKVAARFPEVNVLMYHPGIGEFYKDAIRAAKEHRNIYLDTAHANPAALQAILDQVPAEQIIYGTDAPWGQWAGMFDLVREKTKSRPDLQRMVMGQNVARLMDLP